MPIRSDVLAKRLTDCLAMLSLHVQAGIEIQNDLTKRLNAVVTHPHMPIGFVTENADYFKETISLLLEYIEQIQTPHDCIKKGTASPALLVQFVRGELKQHGITLVDPSVSITACYDDNDTLKYYSLTKGA